MNQEDELRRLLDEYREQVSALYVAFETRLQMLYSDFRARAVRITGQQHPFPEPHAKLEQDIQAFKDWVRDGKPIPSPDPDPSQSEMPFVPAELQAWIAEVEARIFGGKESKE